jgi:hypothetical protein
MSSNLHYQPRGSFKNEGKKKKSQKSKKLAQASQPLSGRNEI